MSDYTQRGGKFLDPAEATLAIEQIGAIAESEGARVLLIGGMAGQLYGTGRLTADVDFASDKILDALPAKRRLSFGGVKTTAPNGVPVDWIVRSDDFSGLYEDAVENGGRQSDDLPMRVVTAEYLVAMKLVAGRPKDTQDIVAMLRRGTVDTAKARAVIKRHLGAFAAREFDSVVDEVAWRKSAGRDEDEDE